MADIGCFFRNRCTTVERVDDQTTRSTCRVQDTLLEAWVEILVKAPDLEIVGVKGQIRRSGEGDRTDISPDLQPSPRRPGRAGDQEDHPGSYRRRAFGGNVIHPFG